MTVEMLKQDLIDKETLRDDERISAKNDDHLKRTTEYTDE